MAFITIDIKKLKSNDLLPIEVLQVSYASKKARGPKKNIMNIDDIMKTANSANILQGREESKHTAREKFNILLTQTLGKIFCSKRIYFPNLQP